MTVAQATGAQAEGSGEELLRMVVRRNNEAIQKIKSIEYKIEWTYDTSRVKKNRQITRGEAHWKRRGDDFLVHSVIRFEYANGGPADVQPGNYVRNRNCTGYWGMNSGQATMFQRDAAHQPTVAEVNMLNSVPQELLKSGFGNNRQMLEEAVKEPEESPYRWSARQYTDARGKLMVTVEKFDTRYEKPRLKSEWIVDPQKDYLVTDIKNYYIRDRKATYFLNDGETSRLWEHRAITHELVDGIAVPVGVEVKMWNMDLPAYANPERTYSLKVIEKRINPEISDAELDFSNLGFDPAKVRVQVYAPGSESARWTDAARTGQ